MGLNDKSNKSTNIFHCTPAQTDERENRKLHDINTTPDNENIDGLCKQRVQGQIGYSENDNWTYTRSPEPALNKVHEEMSDCFHIIHDR